jgi:hypothetical protein
MYISLTESRTAGFLKWSAAHRAVNDDDDDTGGATPIALAKPRFDRTAPEEKLSHSPWAIPGVGGAF